MNKKLLSTLLIAAIITMIFTGCGSNQTTSNDKNDGQSAANNSKPSILRMASDSSPSGVFNPALIQDQYNGYITDLVYEALVIMNDDIQYEPALAERWEISDDSQSITFYLRKNVKWHDGKPFTAEDVKFTYEFIAHPDYPGSKSSFISAISGFKDFNEGKSKSLEGIEIIDDYTVKIKTDGVYAPFLDKICFQIKIIPKHVWEKVEVSKSIEATDLLRNPIGTGPFKFKEFSPDRYTIVEKNEDYWAGIPKLDSIVIQVVNPETVQAQMLNGEIDYLLLLNINPDDMKTYLDAGFKQLQINFTGFQHMAINNDNPILGHKAVRQAFAHAINRQGIVDSLLYGYGNVANTAYIPSFWAYPGEDKLNPYEYNPEKAIEILTKEAGWQYKDGKMYVDGKPLKLTLTYPSGNKVRELSAPIIQENFKNIGIELELQMMEFPTASARLKKGEFELGLVGHGLGADADARRHFHTDSIGVANNSSRYSNPELDKLLEEGVKYLEVEKRKPIYHEAAILINEEMPTIFLYNGSGAVIMSPKLNGVKTTGLSTFYDIHNWYFK